MLIKSSISIDNLKYYNDSFIAVDSVSTKEQIIVKTYGFFHRDFFFSWTQFQMQEPASINESTQTILPLDAAT